MPVENLQEGIQALSSLCGKEITIQNCILQIIEMRYMNANLDWYVAPHVHPWYELHYVQSGEAHTVLGEKRIIAKPGQYYIIPPESVHGHNQSKANGPHSGLALRWQVLPNKVQEKKGSGLYIYDLEKGLCDKKIRDASVLEIQMQHLFDLKIKYNSSIMTLLTSLASIIFSLSNEDYRVHWKGIKDMSCSLTYQALLFINDNYDRKLNIHEVANALGVSYPYLARVFKRDMQKTLVSYLQEVRIQEAKKHLGHTKKTLKEIAAEVGFENEYYLSNVFKKVSGVSPKHYRESITDI